MKLRDFQEKFVRDIAQALMHNQSVLACAPTGSGKTVVMSHITNELVKRGERVLIVVHRDELLRQTSHKLHAYGVHHGTLTGGRHVMGWHSVQVATIQSAVRRRFNPRWLMFDEAHLSKAASWTNLRSQYPDARLIGFSATPTRLSGEGFQDMYGKLVMGPSVAELMARGYLTGYRAFAPTAPNLDGVKTQGGDWNQGQLAEVMSESKLVGSIPDHWRKLADGRVTIAFGVNRAHSARMAEEFRSHGIAAEHIDGSMDKAQRRAILSRFGKQTLVLCSVLLFTEGFDKPEVSAIVSARPTQSLALHLQMIGRGLRTHPGKQDCIILDHSNNLVRHGFPDDPREWTQENRKRRSRSADEELAPESLPRVCPECKQVAKPGARYCPCGYVFAAAPAREIEQVDGELKEITERPKYSDSAYGVSDDPAVKRIIEQVKARGNRPGQVYVLSKQLEAARTKYRDTLGIEPKATWSSAQINAIMERSLANG